MSLLLARAIPIVSFRDKDIVSIFGLDSFSSQYTGKERKDKDKKRIKNRGALLLKNSIIIPFSGRADLHRPGLD